MQKLALTLGLILGLMVQVPAVAQTAETMPFTVTLLGTGAPPPDPNRFGPATLVQAGTQTLLFDVGRGAPIRLWQKRVPLRDIDAVFLTHLHSDHVVGIPDVWLSGWLGGPFARRTTPFRIFGPEGTDGLMAGLWQAYSEDRRIRIEDENYPIKGIAIDAQEFTSDGVVYEAEDVRVTAFTVDHGEHIKPAFGYLIEFDGRSVVLSGDTRKSDAVIAHATGANLLVHEVAAVRPELLSDAQVLRVMNHHTSPQEAGEVFDKAAPGLAVYSHLVLLARPGVSALTADELIGQTRATYSGPLRVGEDLMTIELLPDGQASVVPEK